MSSVTLICGRLACGKSTYAAKLRETQLGVVLSVDEMMLALLGQHAGDLHDLYAARTKEYLLQKSLELLQWGIPVILDWGFWQQEERSRIKTFYAENGITCSLHYLDVEETLRQERLKKRNQAVLDGTVQAYFIDEAIAEKCRRKFEEPEDTEVDLHITE